MFNVERVCPMEFSQQELMQCIFDCCTEDLPDGWEEMSLFFESYGKSYQAGFSYRINGDSCDYEPTNHVAPMNAAQELLKILQAKGNVIKSLTITIQANGSMKII